jgi:hypothetical protein
MKSTALFISTLILFFSIPTHAQWGTKIKGNGNVVEQTRELTSYDEISISGNSNVILVRGSEGEITLKAEENLLDHIEVSVKNDMLKIKNKGRIELIPSKGKNILITIPIHQVSKLSLNGSGEVEGNNLTLHGNKIKLQVNGSGDMEVNVKTADVRAAINGSGDINISGETDYFEAIVTGSGDIDGYELFSNICEGKVIGSGDIKFYARQKLDAKIIGSGYIKINESVVKIEKKIVGSGAIKKIRIN